jgi:hypothetical protein
VLVISTFSSEIQGIYSGIFYRSVLALIRSVCLVFICVHTFILYSQNSELIYMEIFPQVCVVILNVEVVSLHDVKEHAGVSAWLNLGTGEILVFTLTHPQP